MPRIALVALSVPALLVGILAAAMALGGPGEVAPMPSINDPFRRTDYSDLPAAQHFTARDGTRAVYRSYTPMGAVARGSVVLVHGSSASSHSMHALAKGFAAAGYVAYALDMRGHGESGRKGHIAYIGQLDDDIEDFMRAVQPARPSTLAGFSAGGGFALRVAASERQTLFDNYLLLSPFISQDAPTYRPDSGGWVSVGLPRMVAVAVLDAAGVRAFNDLTVTRFALNERAKALLTPQYSFALAQSFRPERDWRATIQRTRQPMALLAGADDEAFHSDQFDAVFKAQGKPLPVTLLPGIGHIALTLQPNAVAAAVAAVDRLNSAAGPSASHSAEARP